MRRFVERRMGKQANGLLNVVVSIRAMSRSLVVVVGGVAGPIYIEGRLHMALEPFWLVCYLYATPEFARKKVTIKRLSEPFLTGKTTTGPPISIPSKESLGASFSSTVQEMRIRSASVESAPYLAALVDNS
jgi:hypothetical protein